MGYYYFIDDKLDIAYVAPFENATEAVKYRNEVHKDCTVALRVFEENITEEELNDCV